MKNLKINTKLNILIVISVLLTVLSIGNIIANFVLINREPTVTEEEPMVEEPMVEPETTEEEKPSEMEELRALVQQIVDEVDKIKKQLEETTALPIDEVAKKCEPKQLNSRALDIAEAIKELNKKQ